MSAVEAARLIRREIVPTYAECYRWAARTRPASWLLGALLMPATSASDAVHGLPSAARSGDTAP